MQFSYALLFQLHSEIALSSALRKMRKFFSILHEVLVVRRRKCNFKLRKAKCDGFNGIRDLICSILLTLAKEEIRFIFFAYVGTRNYDKNFKREKDDECV